MKGEGVAEVGRERSFRIKRYLNCGIKSYEIPSIWIRF